MQMTSGRLMKLLLWSVVSLATALTNLLAAGPDGDIDFREDVKPILNQHCVGCHGGVKQASGVSFIYREAVLGNGKSGRRVVVPGDADASELVRRIRSEDPDERMPPPGEHGGDLSEAERGILERWVAQGAPWEGHWAYEPVKQPEPPESDWGASGLDAFVSQRLEEEGLSPSAEASPAEWLRRASFDLTGLPPSKRLLGEFAPAASPEDYERVVDDLLASEDYGERWAALWLDLARYADTQGYEKDLHRDIWLYRDWVIRAFNDDMPFDEFTVKQLAGDLLPSPTMDDFVATAFHRNTQTNTEGGTDDEEFRMAAIMDRVNTTWTVWQATTFGCVQCHSHPYEPIDHEEYYQFTAFFNQSEDADLNNDFPVLKVPKDRGQFERALQLRSEVQGLRGAVNEPGRQLEDQIAWEPADISEVGGVEAASFSVEGGEVRVGGTVPQGATYELELETGPFTALRVELLPESDDPKTMPEHGQVLSYLRAQAGGEDVVFESVYSKHQSGPFAPSESLRKGAAGGGAHPKIWEPHWLVFVGKEPVNSSGGKWRLFLNQDVRSSTTKGSIMRRFRISISNDPRWLELARESAPQKNALRAAEKALEKIPSHQVPVMLERPPVAARETRLFRRGNFLDKDRIVAPGVPDLLAGQSEQDGRVVSDRLAMARWLVSADNPLTARVLANRLWAALFGKGLVETVEDFGSTGLAPSHPALLDWLAWRLQHAHGWRLKPFLKELVLSATYRQTHAVSADKLSKDPRNRWLSRGPRTRLSAEMVRDQALQVSGLLSKKRLGPSVMPPQPDGVWSVVYSSSKWVTPEGGDRYRRGLYTYWRRTSPYPSFLSFDAPSREVCTARRLATNTPLQALVTMNVPVYVEAAQALAARMLEEGGDRLDSQLRWAYQLVNQRQASPMVVEELRELVRDAERAYGEDAALSEALGATPSTAALVLAANTILNLDVSLTK